MDGDGVPDKEDDDVDLKAQKLHCKYRKSCYEQLGVEDKKEDSSKEDDLPSFFSGKLQVVKGEKKTLKDIAKKTMKKVDSHQKPILFEISGERSREKSLLTSTASFGYRREKDEWNWERAKRKAPVQIQKVLPGGRSRKSIS